MTLRCVLFGHRRSRSRATYDETRGRWISVCKRCHVMLEREDHRDWRPIAPPVGKLERIERDRPVPNEQRPVSEGNATANMMTPDQPQGEAPLIGAAHREKAAVTPKERARAS